LPPVKAWIPVGGSPIVVLMSVVLFSVLAVRPGREHDLDAVLSRFAADIRNTFPETSIAAARALSRGTLADSASHTMHVVFPSPEARQDYLSHELLDQFLHDLDTLCDGRTSFHMDVGQAYF
jgi:Stress responsive A/B Barrel Domain